MGGVRPEDCHRIGSAWIPERGRVRDLQSEHSEYAVAFHAVSLLGGVNTTINPYTVPELSAQLRDSGARYLVTVPACAEKAEQAARESGVQRRIRVRRDRTRHAPSSRCSFAECAPRCSDRTARGSRRDALFERDHRPAERGDAHASQPGDRPTSCRRRA